MRRRAVDHLVERVELLDRLVDARIALVEAPGGYGKTTLGAQLGVRLGCATARAALERMTDTAGLVAELRRALSALALSDAVAIIDVAADPLEAAFDALAARGEPIVLVVDEVQRLLPDAAAALARVTRGVPSQVRVLLCGRRLPAPLSRLLDDPGVIDVGIAELRFDAAETERLLVAALGAGSAVLAPSLHQASGGWPAAVVVAARQLAVSPERSLAGLGEGPALLGRLLDGSVDQVPEPLRVRLPTLAALPLLDRRLVDDCFGAGAFDSYVDAGLAIAPRADGWCTMPDPVREVLLGRGPVDAAVATEAARRLRDAGEVTAAADLVARHADSEELACFLSGCTTEQMVLLGLGRLSAFVSVIGNDALARHPDVLYLGAVAAEMRDDDLRGRWLRHAAELTERTDPVAHRRVLAEQMVDLIRFGQPADVLDGHEALLAGMGPGEVVARGRVLMAVVAARVFSIEPTARHELRPMLREAAELFRLAHKSRWEAETWRRLATSIELRLGEYDRSIEAFGRVLSLLAAPDRDRAMSLTYYAEALEFAGRIEEADAAVREARAIGLRIGDARAVWFASWTATLLAARAGDRDTVDRCLAEVVRVVGPLPCDGNGFEYLVTVADALAGMGDVARARHYLDRARPLAVRLQRQSAVDMVDARLHALDGDPVEAERLLDAIEGAPYAVPEQRWTRLLERAIAARRRGDVERARVLTTEVLAAAAALGHPDHPARYEPHLLARVSDLVPAPAGAVGRVARLSLLGRFALAEGGEDRTPAPGQPTALVALVALRRSIAADELIEWLWPDVDEATGRSRLRNLLNRVRERAGDVVVRVADQVVLGDHVEVDAAVFERLADDALRAPAADRCGRARHAIAQWSGELLPEQRFADWAAGPRERLRRRYLSLLDVVVDDASTRGELDDAIRHLELAIDTDPLDEARHVQLVRALLRQGRRTSARRALDQACAMVGELGVRPSAELAVLVDELA